MSEQQDDPIRGAAVGAKTGFGPDVPAGKRGINIHHYDEGTCQDDEMRRIAICLGILGDTAKEILEYLKEQPGTEQVALLLCGAIQRAELALKSRCNDLDTIRTELCEVKAAICHIRQAVDTPAGGLEGIKREINWIGEHLPEMKGFCPNVTSGSVIVEDCSTQVLVAVKNTTTHTQTVRVRVLRDDLCPAVVLIDKCLMVSGCCSNAVTVPFDNASAYEIEVFGLVPGMTVSSVELDVCKRLIKCSRLTAAQFICLGEKCS